MAQEQARPARFGRALTRLILERDDLRERFLTRSGNVRWTAVAAALPTTSYESLRKAVSNERYPPARVMEEVAEFLAIEPSYFVEYALIKARKAFDPDELGGGDEGFEAAAENLRRWEKAAGD